MDSNKEKLEVLEGIKKSAEILKDRWISGAEAKDKDGFDIEPDDPEAYTFCSIGVLQHVFQGKTNPHYEKALCVMQEAARKRLERRGMSYLDYEDLDAMESNLIDVNDSIGKRAARGMFLEAAKTLEKELKK